MDLGFDAPAWAKSRGRRRLKGIAVRYFAERTGCLSHCQEEALEQGKVAFNFDPARDVTTTLIEFGQAYIQLLCRPARIGHPNGNGDRRAEPEVGRRFYNNVIALTIARSAAYLEARATAGDLESRTANWRRRSSCRCVQASLFMHYFSGSARPSAERIAEVVESATRMFSRVSDQIRRTDNHRISTAL